MSVVASSSPATRTIASLPGPRTLPFIGNLHQFDARRSHQIFESMARKYGPAFKFRLGPHQLVVLADAEAAMKVLRERPNEFTRSRVTRPIFEELGVQGLFAAEGDDWRRQRPIIMRTLDPGHLKRFFPTIVTACERLLRRWQAARGAPLEVRDDLTRFTVDVICSLAFGTDVATLDQHDPDPLQKHLDQIFSGINRRMFAPFPFWRYYKSAADRELEKSKVVVFRAVEGYIANARAQIAARPELKRAPENLLQALLAATEDERLSEYDLVGNVLTMLLAGEDTTAGTIAWTMHLLATHPQEVVALRAEVDGILGNQVAIHDFDATRSMPVAEAVIMEALRIKPVAPLLGFTPIRDTTVAGIELPAGSRVILLMRVPGMDAQRFPQPAVFRPQRWLDGDTASTETGTKRTVMPFGAGPRFCPGRYLAMLEAKMALASIVHAFDIEPATDTVEEFMSLTMHPHNLKLRLLPRKREPA